MLANLTLSPEREVLESHREQGTASGETPAEGGCNGEAFVSRGAGEADPDTYEAARGPKELR